MFALLQYSFYQSIYYSEKDTFPTTSGKYGHWLRVVENVGSTLTYWILTNKNTVIARSLVRPVEECNTNNRCTPDESQVNDIGGRHQQELLLALLLKMINEHSPEIDITKIDT